MFLAENKKKEMILGRFDSRNDDYDSKLQFTTGLAKELITELGLDAYVNI